MVQYLVTTLGVKWYVYVIHIKSQPTPRPRRGSQAGKTGVVNQEDRQTLRFQSLFCKIVAEKENGLRLARTDGNSNLVISPETPSKTIKTEVIDAIVKQRKARNRCAEVVHQELLNQGIAVSLSSVKRTLKRQGLIRHRSPWKRWRFSEARPEAVLAGDLAQVDTIHYVIGKKRFYVYTLIDVASRWAYAKVSLRINPRLSLQFVKEALQISGFGFKMIQSDHGQEFSTWFTENVGKLGISHRHSRVRKPNDNGHLERFNRTLQEECLNKVNQNPKSFQKAINEYLPYYNGQRLHLSLNFSTPLEWLKAID